MLDYTLCHYRVWHSFSPMKMSSRVGVHKYMTEYYFLCVRMFYHVLLGCFFVVRIPWSFSGKRRLLTCIQHTRRLESRAAHGALLTCFLLSCITQIITCKNSSHAVHESWLACSSFHITYVFWLQLRQKLKNTCVFTTHEWKLDVSCTVYPAANTEMCWRHKLNTKVCTYAGMYVCIKVGLTERFIYKALWWWLWQKKEP